MTLTSLPCFLPLSPSSCQLQKEMRSTPAHVYLGLPPGNPRCRQLEHLRCSDFGKYSAFARKWLQRRREKALLQAAEAAQGSISRGGAMALSGIGGGPGRDLTQPAVGRVSASTKPSSQQAPRSLKRQPSGQAQKQPPLFSHQVCACPQSQSTRALRSVGFIGALFCEWVCVVSGTCCSG